MLRVLACLFFLGCGYEESPGCKDAGFRLYELGICVLNPQQLTKDEIEHVWFYTQDFFVYEAGLDGKTLHQYKSWYQGHNTVIAFNDDYIEEGSWGVTTNHIGPFEETSWIAIVPGLSWKQELWTIVHEELHVLRFMYQDVREGHSKPYFSQSFPYTEMWKGWDERISESLYDDFGN